MSHQRCLRSKRLRWLLWKAACRVLLKHYSTHDLFQALWASMDDTGQAVIRAHVLWDGEIKGGSVCLGVTAPPNVNIVRDELLDKEDDSDGRRS